MGEISKKRLILVFIMAFFFVLSIVSLIIVNYSNEPCFDGTLLDSCSDIQPFYCFQGELIERASLCGCFNVLKIDGDKCVSEYQTGEKNITLNYVLRGKKGKIDFVVYEGLYNYLVNLPRHVSFKENFTLLDFRKKMIDEENQRQFLLPLFLEIKKITSNKEDQARIAISLVQNIPFGSSSRVSRLGGITFDYQRYPYEVLYDNQGVCGEKSELLVFLLREIGYGVAFIYYPEENHEAVGIKCPIEQGVDNVEFCFIETTGPSIITDDKTEYLGIVELKSSPKVLVVLEDGLSLGKYEPEYFDAKMMIDIRNFASEHGQLGLLNYLKYKILKKKYGIGY
jgi:hypothetical protein